LRRLTAVRLGAWFEGVRGSTLAAALLYLLATVALTWPLLPRAARDVPSDLVDPLFTCWALGWNYHVLGLSPEGAPAPSYWDANIFHPLPRSFARSEHYLPQALQGAAVYLTTRNLVLTYNVLFLSTFVLSGLFFFLLARDETGDAWAALAAGLFYAFALFRWTQLAHLGALSSQWMPLALLLARRVARGGGPRRTAALIAALGLVTAVQALSSAYYLLFFPPFLALWAAVEAKRAGGRGPWLRLAAAGAMAAALVLPMALPYLALSTSGAERDLASVVANSADLLSFVVASEFMRVWGRLVDVVERGEARLFPGLVTPLLTLVALVAAVRAARGGAAGGERPPAAPPRSRVAVRMAAVALCAAGLAGFVTTLARGWWIVVPGRVPAAGMAWPFLLLAAALLAALAGWPGLRALLRAVVARREVLAAALAALAAWLAMGPVLTFDGWPIRGPSAYRWLYDHVPGFSGVRSPGRFAMIAACYAALAAAWGLKHLRRTPWGRRVAWLLCGLFLAETVAVPLPLSLQMGRERRVLPEWRGTASPIVTAVLELPRDAVLAELPLGEVPLETRAMFDSAHHWRRLLNGYSSWIPEVHRERAFAFRDPLRRAPEVLAALGEAGATHVVVHERAWRGEGPQVTERLVAAGARPVARAGHVALLAVR